MATFNADHSDHIISTSSCDITAELGTCSSRALRTSAWNILEQRQESAQPGCKENTLDDGRSHLIHGRMHRQFHVIEHLSSLHLTWLILAQ